MPQVLPADDTPFEVEVPLVVVGAGAAGLIAALAAQEAGAEVLVLERDAVPQGSTALSAGLIPAAGTAIQRAAGIMDEPARFAADVTAKAEGLADPALVSLVTGAVAPAVDWLHARFGLPFTVITDFRYPGHSAHRMHGLPSRSGAALIDALRSAAEGAGIDILCEARVTTLLVDPDRRIRGVVYERPDGSTERVGCGALVLACNGYGGNRTLVGAHIPALSDALYFGHPGNQGEALLWGQALGAAQRDLSGHQGHGSVAEPGGILITWATITEGGIQVNARGERFSDEGHGYSEQAAAVLAQPGRFAWTVFDGRIAAIARQFEDFRQAEAAGLVVEAPDPASLAARMRVPAEALAATLRDVAALKAAGARDAFGRDFAAVPPLTAPFCAVRVTGALFHTQGGLAVDAATHVRLESGASLPNLLAAGGAAAGVSGPHASGYLSGNGLLTAVALGWLAGREGARLTARLSPTI